MINDPHDLPWYRIFHHRCRAVLEPNKSGFWGRCELKANHDGEDHALERGFYFPRWSTRLIAL